MKDKHEPKISLEEYIKKARTFRIPDYQRGYIWGQSCRYGMERKADSVNFMLDTLLSAFEDIPHRDVFIQGITVHEDNKNGMLTVIDGQQRTTFFYLLLKWLGCQINFNLHYEIRTKTNDFLKDLDALRVSSEPLSEEEPYQDIYFMKKSLIVFQDRLNNIDKEGSIEMLLKHLGMDWDYTIAFGDNNVDVMMITKAHIGVAMGNGRDIVKQASDFVTKDVDDNGLAYAIEQIGL